MPANIQEIADQQLQKTAPDVIQNKENVQFFKDFNRNIREIHLPIITNVLTIPPYISGVTITKVTPTTQISSISDLITNSQISNATGISMSAIITDVATVPEETFEPEVTGTSTDINLPTTQAEVSEQTLEAQLTELTDEPLQEEQQPTEEPQVILPVVEPQQTVEVSRPPPFNIEDLPIVVEIPIFPKIERDAEIGDIINVPKLIDIEKFTIKQEVVSPVRCTAPNPFEDDSNEVIKENVMVQIPQENLVKCQPPEDSPPQKKKRGRKKKIQFEEPPEPTNKRKSDTQKPSPTNKKKKAEAPPAKKTRTKTRSKSLQELSSTAKLLRVKSPLELNEILKAKHNDFHVPKADQKSVVGGMKKSITKAIEKHNSHL